MAKQLKPKELRHPGGAPRTKTPSELDMIALGKEMVEWVMQNKPIHLSQWYTIHKEFTYNQWKSFIQKEEFIPYYEKSLKLVGVNYLDGTINPSISQRFLRVYYKDLKEGEDQDHADKIERERAAISQNVAPNERIIERDHENMMLKSKIAELEAKLANQSETG